MCSAVVVCVALQTGGANLVADAEVAGVNPRLHAHHDRRQLSVAAVQVPQEAAHAGRQAAPGQRRLLCHNAVLHWRQQAVQPRLQGRLLSLHPQPAALRLTMGTYDIDLPMHLWFANVTVWICGHHGKRSALV